MSPTARPPNALHLAIRAYVILLACGSLASAAGPAPDHRPAEPAGPRVSLGPVHACVIAAEGSLWCWGRNDHGQLGDRTTRSVIEPVRIGQAEDWLAIQAARELTCGLRAPGSLWCWGRMLAASPGGGARDDATAPVRVGRDEDWISLSARDLHACAIKREGSLWCWGRNELGQLGDGTKQDRAEPVRIGKRSDWLSLSAGRTYTCALTTGGEAWCWGHNGVGVLGNGTAKDRTRPTRVAGGRRYREISAGGQTTFGLDEDGVLWQWGVTGAGPSGRRWLSPIKVGQGSGWTRLVAGAACGLAQDGRLGCWQGGDRLASAAGKATWREVAAFGPRACGLESDGSLWCWGEDPDCLLGIRRRPVPPARVGLDHYRHLVIDRAETCAVSRDGSRWCWGAGRFAPVRQDAANDWAQYAAAGRTGHGCKLDTKGSLWCWDAAPGAEPDDSADDPGERSLQIGAAGEWKAVAIHPAGLDQARACAIKADSSLWCWQTGAADPIGGQQPGARPGPVRIADRGFDDLRLGDFFECGLKQDGTIWCWGLSHPSCKHRLQSAPMRLAGKWTALVDTSQAICALDSDGAVSCWSCQDETWKRNPAAGDGWAQVAAGDGLGGVKRDDSLWAIPRGLAGLNCPAGPKDAAPVRLGQDTDWASVAVGLGHACALKKDGSLWCWGDEEGGALGIGRPAYQRAPVHVRLGQR